MDLEKLFEEIDTIYVGLKSLKNNLDNRTSSFEKGEIQFLNSKVKQLKKCRDTLEKEYVKNKFE